MEGQKRNIPFCDRCLAYEQGIRKARILGIETSSNAAFQNLFQKENRSMVDVHCSLKSRYRYWHKLNYHPYGLADDILKIQVFS